MLSYAFEQKNVFRIQFATDKRNIRSQKAIERLGAVKEGVLRSHQIYPDGHRRDTIFYSVLDHDWPAIKERLETFLKT
jgi:RimJ/RimL family protein N-acetyltransferase